MKRVVIVDIRGCLGVENECMQIEKAVRGWGDRRLAEAEFVFSFPREASRKSPPPIIVMMHDARLREDDSVPAKRADAAKQLGQEVERITSRRVVVRLFTHSELEGVYIGEQQAS